MNYTIQLSAEEIERLEAAKEQGVEVDRLIREFAVKLPISKAPPESEKLSSNQAAPCDEEPLPEFTEEELYEFIDDLVHRVVRGGERQPDGTMKYK